MERNTEQDEYVSIDQEAEARKFEKLMGSSQPAQQVPAPNPDLSNSTYKGISAPQSIPEPIPLGTQTPAPKEERETPRAKSKKVTFWPNASTGLLRIFLTVFMMIYWWSLSRTAMSSTSQVSSLIVVMDLIGFALNFVFMYAAIKLRLTKGWGWAIVAYFGLPIIFTIIWNILL